MGLYSGAIHRGTAAGLVQGLWTSLGCLPPGAQIILENPNRENLSHHEKGLRDGLIRTGHLKRRWWIGRYEVATPNKGGDEIRDAVDAAVLARFVGSPDEPLTELGFRTACVYALRLHWPNVSASDAASWLTDYAGAPVGTPGYEWTFNGARNLALNYVADYGEAA